ncbi:Kelch domain-containing protein 4 [Hypsizygus marmoreus]|uniref:Kelch domain-containing protein 4 n=1 Tax=Hypsizygus marmoreus TaxID=39966 RepID=A0A369J9J6_HYPMA|nr:Kelch domain-containing protein 4 [Hypsizygus marmoreus]
MAKKKAITTKSTTKAAKKAKAAQKIERKEKKKNTRGKDDEDDDEDLEGILEKMRREWEEAHTVTEELVEGPPSRRANATLTACPNGNHIWCIGGEFFSDDGKAYFYNDVFRYSIQDEWRKFVSPTCPGPRSAHAVVATPAGGGKIFLFGGEFSSLHQTTFHHYRDFWCFDITTHSWDRIDTKVRPSARSGHRMAAFKHYIVLFGGFYDPGITTRYLNDLWVFDTQEYKWRQIEFKETDNKPSPRSGFSFLSSPDGILLHGGYCKEYAKGKRPVGVMLEDTWFLHISITVPSAETTTKSKPTHDTLTVKWERRKKPSYAPSIRSGCTMTLWPSKNTGILFGGVTDEDRNEETLESVFWNDLYGYQIPGKGKWVSMALKRPKKKAGGTKRKKNAPVPAFNPDKEEDGDSDVEEDGEVCLDVPSTPVQRKPEKSKSDTVVPAPQPDIDSDDPNLTIPLPRYNAMLAVLRNTLYIYGGIYERGSREYTLDDFYALQLDKMERYVCLKESGVVIGEGDDESSSDDDDDDDDDDEEDEDEEDGDGGEDSAQGERNEEADAADETIAAQEAEEKLDVEQTQAEREELRSKAAAFMGVAKDASRSPEDVISTPLPGETLAMFYARSREFWSQKAHNTSDNRGKQLRRDGFALAEERYATYKPILEEVEKILAEAGLDEEEMRRGAAAGPMGPEVGQSRNRR